MKKIINSFATRHSFIINKSEIIILLSMVLFRYFVYLS